MGFNFRPHDIQGCRFKMIRNEILKRKMPDFFVKDGAKIDSLEKWEEYKDELLSLILSEEYGALPPKIIPSVEIKNGPHGFGGKASWQTIYFTFEVKGKSHTVKTDLILPRDAKNIPVFVNIGFEREIPNKYLPVEEILDNGFGIFYFCYKDVTEDNGDFESGLAGLFENGGKDFGKISLWAYMAVQCMDYLITLGEVDKENIAVIGHSRLGKTALLTAALDERFKLCCTNNSGCCGASISRGKTDKNEKISDITRVFPFWFKESFIKYVDNEDSLPFDQHMLISLVAPRYIVIGGAKEDCWADNDGQFLSAYLASYAWELYGEKGLVCRDYIPQESEKLLDGKLGFYLREREHFLSRYDWNVYMDKFKEIITR